MKGRMKTGWLRKFENPISLSKSRTLITLQDAGTYITKVKKAGHIAPELQAAMQALILVATRDGPTMLPRIVVMRALNRHAVREFSSRKGAHWGRAKLARDRRD